MCGIAGKMYLDGVRPVDTRELIRMTATLRHRGPDDEGVWASGSVGLGSRRLAIIDLSPRGHQPMPSHDGSLHLAFNGEIYNFQALRAELERKGHAFRSDSDTEVLLRLYEEEGVGCLGHLRGMFAFALWDARRRMLFLARDRLGKKPLFYHRDAEALRFASEPKAIFQDPGVPAEADPEAIHHYLTYGYVPSPWSAFRGMRKLPPAHYLTVRDGEVRVERYWSLAYRPKRQGSEPALAEELLALLEEAVRLRLISDVPLGALLSGGVDSSTVVALMHRLGSSGRVRTFSIGFDQPEYDELAYARDVAQRFETDHHELVVKPDAAAILPRLVWHYNEPFADSSALPSMALCEMARGFVTVALAGDGGDETFLGYDRYRATALADWADRIPAPVRGAVSRVVDLLPRGVPKSLLYRLRRFVEALELPPWQRYAQWMTILDGARKAELCTADFIARAAGDSLELLQAAFARSDAPAFVEAAAHADIQLYLPDDLLVKMDIASMAHSLEVRSPFLDHRVVEFAATLPAPLKLRGLTQKYLLKRVMRGTLPDRVLDRKKMGFGVPIDRWFRHELREMAYDVLLDSQARARGYFRPDVVRRYLDEHVRGQAHHHTRLWALLVLELWHRVCIDQRCPAEAPVRL